MEILKFIICTTILLALVAALMIVCDAWSGRVFVAYVVIAVMAIIACVLLYN